MDTVKTLYRQLDDVFTPSEAWGLFRAITYIETVGWLLLLSGIFSKIAEFGFSEWYMPVVGCLHGVGFVGYILLIFFAHRSMKWTTWQFLVAEAACNVPFGALIFERYIIKKHHQKGRE